MWWILHNRKNHLDYSVPYLRSLLGVGLLNALLEQPNGLLHGQDTRELEEDSLHDHVDMLPQASVLSDGAAVDDVEVGLHLGHAFLNLMKREDGETPTN